MVPSYLGRTSYRLSTTSLVSQPHHWTSLVNGPLTIRCQIFDEHRLPSPGTKLKELEVILRQGNLLGIQGMMGPASAKP